MSAPFTLHVGDALEQLRGLATGSVQTCITSPPYFGLRDYGTTGQLGREKTPEKYVARLVEIFGEVKRVLRDDGTLWLNLGDSYAGARGGAQGKSGQMANRSVVAARCRERNYTTSAPGLKGKNLIGIPWRVAFALQADGWFLRQDIIWHKPNPMPAPVVDRCVAAHEYIFLLSKRPKYHFDFKAIREPATGRAAGNGFRRPERISVGGRGNPKRFEGVELRNKRSVWSVCVGRFKGAHFATFPPDLIAPCVLAGAPTGGLVLDPFAGAGTTALVALREGRRFVGVEINPEYARMAERRVQGVQVELRGAA